MLVVGPYFFKGGSIMTEFFVGFLICTVIALTVAITVGLIYIRNLEAEIKELRDENDKLKIEFTPTDKPDYEKILAQLK